MPDTAEIQAWMQSAIFAGGTGAAAAGQHVRTTRGLGARQRVGIYAQGYRARLVDVLQDEYPVLRRFAGDTVFGLFAESYLAVAPSTRPSLWDFGAGFADHLAGTAPAEAAEPGSLLAVPAELARLERARAEVQRARGVERSAAAAGAAVQPVHALSLRIRLPDSARLLRLSFDFGAMVRAVDGGDAAGLPAPGPWHVAVARAHYRVVIHTLDSVRFRFLERIAAGATTGDAAAGAASEAGRPLGALLGELMLWLPLAAQQGLVAAAASQ